LRTSRPGRPPTDRDSTPELTAPKIAAALHTQLIHYAPWYRLDASNMARYLATRAELDLIIDSFALFRDFNGDAAARRKPAISYSAFQAALDQLASAVGLLEWHDSDVVLSILPPAEDRLPLPAPLTEANLAAVDAMSRIAPADVHGAVVKFAGSMLRNTPGRSLPGKTSYAAYLIWAKALSSMLMPESHFTSLMTSLVVLLGSPTVAVETAADGSVTFKGLSL
jgi:hypothetical protein